MRYYEEPYNDVKIRFMSAYMAYDEIGDIKKINYMGDGKWRAYIKSLSVFFSEELVEAQGYEFDHNDYYMGYDVYTKIVGIESLTSVDIPMKITEPGKSQREACVRVAVPECLKEEINNYLIASGDIVLSAEIFRKLVEHYTIGKIIELEREQGREGVLYDYDSKGWRFIDCKQSKEETDKT
ncbi:MAG: hypothetical protein K2K57_04210 [Oscillospiraceae bacterium]|nr:hypothetical protein [Oscillospiraceae bacterium]